MPATHRALLFVLVLTSVCLTGCISWKKGGKPKENKAVATEVEENFRQRWIENRAAELMNRGVSPHLARTQAIEEFRLNYSYTRAAEQR